MIVLSSEAFESFIFLMDNHLILLPKGNDDLQRDFSWKLQIWYSFTIYSFFLKFTNKLFHLFFLYHN